MTELLASAYTLVKATSANPPTVSATWSSPTTLTELRSPFYSLSRITSTDAKAKLTLSTMKKLGMNRVGRTLLAYAPPGLLTAKIISLDDEELEA